MTGMPVLETERLTIRPFALEDLDVIYRILDIELGEADFGSESLPNLQARKKWLEWTILGYEQFANLYLPPYGERAICLRPNGPLIGAIGLVPCIDAFDRLPYFQEKNAPWERVLFSAEAGLFYAVSPEYQGCGYASEAARRVIEFLFYSLHLKRVVATTRFDNRASIGVMERLGMQIERNPGMEPPWLQVVGVLENRLWER